MGKIAKVIIFGIFMLSTVVFAEVPMHNPGLDSQCSPGFQYSRDTASCKQANCPEGAGRTYTLECNCGEAWGKPFRTCYKDQLAVACVPAGSPCPGEQQTTSTQTTATQPDRDLTPDELKEILKPLGYSDCSSNYPKGTNPPPGSVMIWDQVTQDETTSQLSRDSQVHSTVALTNGLQIEMGHAPAPGLTQESRYVSGAFDSKDGPKPTEKVGGKTSWYELREVWCPPPGKQLDTSRMASWVGKDRNYKANKPDRWNCHGFAANVAYDAVKASSSSSSQSLAIVLSGDVSQDGNRIYPGAGINSDNVVSLKNAILLWKDGTRIDITTQESKISVGPILDPTSLLQLLGGNAEFFAGQKSHDLIPSTINAIFRPKGTRFILSHDEATNVSTVEVEEGEVEVVPFNKSLEIIVVKPGQQHSVGPDSIGAGSSVPQYLQECENGGTEFCGTWSLQGNQYYANWDNGATATLNVEHWDASGVVLTRYDSGGSSAGLSARYEGQINGNIIENGKVTWTWNGKTWSGNWKANWNSNMATPAPTNLALHKFASQSSTATDWGGNWYPSRGVDEIKTGNIYDGGFHTDNEVNPWWQVDLGARSQLTEVHIYNRLDCCSDRSRTLQVLLSDEGQNWRVVYSHDGSVFGGADGKYLNIKLNNEIAGFVRVQLREKNWFHLDEVEVYGVSL